MHQTSSRHFTAAYGLYSKFTGETASAQAEPFQFGEVFRWGRETETRGEEKSSVCGAILLHDQGEGVRHVARAQRSAMRMGV